MRCFVAGVYGDLKEQCFSSMIHDNMNISHLMVHSQQVEGTRVKRKSRDSHRERPFDSGSSRDMLDI